jgi:O-antigen biosynthesis protein
MVHPLLLASARFGYRTGLLRWRRLRGLRRRIDRNLLLSHDGILFNVEEYLRLNEDVASAGYDPVVHYLRFGLSERRRAQVLFDSQHYLNQIPARERRIAPLVHYVLYGADRGLEPNPWFDPRYYAASIKNEEVPVSDAYLHFLREGNRADRRPSAAFDPQAYLRRHPEAAETGLTALEHFITYVAVDKSLTQEAALQGLPRPRPAVPAPRPKDLMAAIRALPVPSVPEPVVDVIIPVYGAAEETLSSILHVLRSSNETPFRVIVVDDHSPDAELSENLRTLAGLGYFELIYHPKNVGFVGSVNDGVAFGSDTDVILLNSDTEVYGGWIDRLRRVAERDDRIASVTPMTNNGTICGYPLFPKDNPTPLECSYEEIDRMTAAVNADEYTVLPTGVGFCMYIKRAALKELGPFDENAFGRGYGEENDFCLRGQMAGWKDVMAPGVFVHHLGSMSFVGEKAKRVEAALEILHDRYPLYRRQVQAFVRDDPGKAFRARLDMQRLIAKAKDRNVLIVCHARGGGTEQHIRTLTVEIEAGGAAVFRLIPDRDASGKVMIYHQDVTQLPNLPSFSLAHDQAALAQALREIGITEAQVHHTVDFGSGAPQQVHELLTRLAIPYSFTVHDYYSVCPRINLIDENGFYCGEPGEAGCNACLTQRGSAIGRPNIRAWRTGFGGLLRDAEKVIAPSGDAAERIHRYFPRLQPIVVPHEADVLPAMLRPPRGKKPIRVAALGAISAIKGFDVLLSCAAWAKARAVPIKFVVIGYTGDDIRAEAAGIEVTGPYRQSEMIREIEEREIDLVFLPSLWPETYSYVLSGAMQTGLPIAVFDIGAPAERLQGVAQGLTLPLDLAKRPSELVKRLVEHAEMTNVGAKPDTAGNAQDDDATSADPVLPIRASG